MRAAPPSRALLVAAMLLARTAEAGIVECGAHYGCSLEFVTVWDLDPGQVDEAGFPAQTSQYLQAEAGDHVTLFLYGDAYNFSMQGYFALSIAFDAERVDGLAIAETRVYNFRNGEPLGECRDPGRPSPRPNCAAPAMILDRAVGVDP